jgi:hypothetical protein
MERGDTLQWIWPQIGRGTYKQGEHIGLVPEDAKGDLGMFLLDRTGGGYERDTVVSDGPIIYGTGMNDADRQKAWKHFFMMMIKAVVRQQGKDALGVKLARRCMPDHDFCTTPLMPISLE